MQGRPLGLRIPISFTLSVAIPVAFALDYSERADAVPIQRADKQPGSITVDNGRSLPGPWTGRLARPGEGEQRL